jgi:predicted nucleic acid-binding protein
MNVFIDSNIFVYVIHAHEKFGKKCKQIIEDIESGKITAFTSALNISEIGEVLFRNAGKIEAIKAIELICALPIEILPISKENTLDAISIFNENNINFADSVISSVMREHFIDTIITNDKHFEKIKSFQTINPNDY